MKVLVLNCGSSSIKYKLFETETKSILAQGGIEKIGLKGSFLKLTLPDGEKVILEKDIPEHTVGIEFILDTLVSKEYGCLSSLEEINAVGHRVVHGGEKFNQSVLIDKAVKEKIIECIDIAPLHNPANLKGIDAVEKILPNVPQVAVFDTAFHQTMPQYAYMYALPYELYEKYGIRRYGFHGNGGSITAIKDGKSVDTSMGLTPVEGLMMGTRCGDVDAGALVFIQEKEGLDYKGVSTLINKKSGVLGISGISSDMREIENAVAQGNEKAKLALTMYEYRIVKYIGAYAAALNGVDVIVFTGGVGENQAISREAVCNQLSFMGVEIDKELNKKIHGKEVELSTPASKVRVVVTPTDEELMIALDTQHIVMK